MLGEIDNIIKTLTVPARLSRSMPHAAGPNDPAPRAAEQALTESDRAESARLMRVNHAGEVAAQALYRGQALTARDSRVKTAMLEAAVEERDHLAWCDARLKELNGRTSILNPLWYLGSLALGAVAGALGDEASLGFIAETEKQVESHLRDHLDRLSPRDLRSRAILTQMTHEEQRHGAKAASMGGKELPFPVILAMRATSKLMTRGSYWL